MKKVYYFGAEWCPSCRRLLPHIKKLQERYGIEILDLDKDEVQFLTKKYQIQTIPALVVDKDGCYDRLVNPTPVTVQALLERE